MNHPTPVLSTDKLYVAHDQYVCNECAGMTAEYTGVTIGGYRLHRRRRGRVGRLRPRPADL